MPHKRQPIRDVGCGFAEPLLPQPSFCRVPFDDQLVFHMLPTFFQLGLCALCSDSGRLWRPPSDQRPNWKQIGSNLESNWSSSGTLQKPGCANRGPLKQDPTTLISQPHTSHRNCHSSLRAVRVHAPTHYPKDGTRPDIAQTVHRNSAERDLEVMGNFTPSQFSLNS
jgi:hypothetical protein